MRLSIFMSIHAILLLLFGIAFLLVPSWTLSLYGASTNDAGLLAGRAFAVSNIMFAAILWSARDANDAQLLAVIVAALSLGNLVNAGIAAEGQFAGTLNTLGWPNVALFAMIGLGYGYYFFKRLSHGTLRGKN